MNSTTLQVPFILKSNLFWLIIFSVVVFMGWYLYGNTIIKSEGTIFSIKKIELDGNERVPDILLKKTSGLRCKANILSFSVNDVKKKLENIAWVKNAIVQKKLPDTVNVRIAERTPIAILQSNYKLYLIDTDGKILEHDGIGNFSNLPIVVGERAEKEISKLLLYLDKFPKIRKQLIFAVRIGKRRWNIKINKGITVRLPERGVLHALNILEEISDGQGFFYDDISVIDLRMLDRVIITKKNTNEIR